MALKRNYGRLAIIFSLILMVLPCAPGRAGQASPMQAVAAHDWYTYYYLHPQPELALEAIMAMRSEGVFDEMNTQSPMTAFFSHLFAQNPERIQSWFAKLDNFTSKQKQPLFRALWLSATPLALEQLKVEARKAKPPVKAQLKKLLATSPPVIAQMEITSASVLDMFWASFIATGDEVYVIRIISALPLIKAQDDLDKVLIGGAAKWSLTSNCIQHQKVLEICKAQVSKVGKDTKRILEEVIEQAETNNP